MSKFYSIPEDLARKYPDAGVYEFRDGDKVAPLVVTKDPSALKVGALVIYGIGPGLSCGVVVDRRGGFCILDDAWTHGGLAEVPERDLLGVSVGLISNSGIVTEELP